VILRKYIFCLSGISAAPRWEQLLSGLATDELYLIRAMLAKEEITNSTRIDDTNLLN